MNKKYIKPIYIFLLGNIIMALPRRLSMISGTPICPVVLGGCLLKLYFVLFPGGRSINTLRITF